MKAYEIVQSLCSCTDNMQRHKQVSSLAQSLASTIDHKLGIQQIPVLRPYADRNIIITCGADSPLVIGAHYDAHIPGPGNRTVPGANDNASGVAVVMEAARYLSHHPIDFVFFGSEEFDCKGSAHYMSAAHKPIRAMVNIDSVARDCEHGIRIASRADGDCGTFKTDDELRCVYFDSAKSKDMGRTENDWMSSGDHYEFLKAGVPAIMITGGDMLFFGMSADRYVKKSVVVHTMDDDLSRVDKPFLDMMVQILVEGTENYLR